MVKEENKKLKEEKKRMAKEVTVAHEQVNPFPLGARFFFSPKIGFTSTYPLPKTDGRSQDSPRTTTSDTNHRRRTLYHRPSLLRGLIEQPPTIYSPFLSQAWRDWRRFFLRRWPLRWRWLRLRWWLHHQFLLQRHSGIYRRRLGAKFVMSAWGIWCLFTTQQ